MAPILPLTLPRPPIDFLPAAATPLGESDGAGQLFASLARALEPPPPAAFPPSTDDADETAPLERGFVHPPSTPPPLLPIAYAPALINAAPQIADKSEADVAEIEATTAKAAPGPYGLAPSLPVSAAEAQTSAQIEKQRASDNTAQTGGTSLAASDTPRIEIAAPSELRDNDKALSDLAAQPLEHAEPPAETKALHPSATESKADRIIAEKASAEANQSAPASLSRATLAIVEMQRKSPTTIEIRLDPPELGALTVEIVRDANGEIRAIVSAERGETLALARRHADILARELAELGDQNAQIDFHEESADHRRDGERRAQRFEFVSPDREANAAFNTMFAAVKSGVDIIA
jgi:flagellar hook-length control protein FliK